MLSRIRSIVPLLVAGACLAAPGIASATIPVTQPQFFQVTVSGTLSTVTNNAGLFDSTVASGAPFTATFFWYTGLPASSSSLAGVSQTTWSAAGAAAGISGTVGDVSISSAAASSETVINTDSAGAPAVNSEQQTTRGVVLTGLSGAYSTDFAQIYLSDPSTTPSLTDNSADWGDAWANKSFFLSVNPASGVVGSLAIGTISSVTVTATPNVSSQFTVSVVSSVTNPILRTYSYKMNATNTGGSSVTGPIQVMIGNIPAGVTLTNASGTAPSGAPFVTISAGSVAAGASAPFTLTFSDPSRVPTNGFTTQVYSGSL